MTDTQLKELRELAYGMSVANLNPEDVRDYMDIASACARMESRRCARRIDHPESNKELSADF